VTPLIVLAVSVVLNIGGDPLMFAGVSLGGCGGTGRGRVWGAGGIEDRRRSCASCGRGNAVGHARAAESAGAEQRYARSKNRGNGGFRTAETAAK